MFPASRGSFGGPTLTKARSLPGLGFNQRTMSSDSTNTPDEKVRAELRKLRLETMSLKLEVRKKKALAASEREKLALEIQSLKRQNGLISRATQIATIFTVLATVGTVLATFFSVWTAYDKFITDKQKETELRQRELTERTEKQFREALGELVRYPTDDKATVSSAVFNFRDIRNVVEGGYHGDELPRRREEVGFLISQLTRSPEFDLTQTSNSEYDRKAMNYCDYYSAHLIKVPGENLDVISKYKDVLFSARRANPLYYASVTVSPDSIFTEGVPAKNEQAKTQFISLYHGYKKHVELLVRSRGEAEAGLKQAQSSGKEAEVMRREVEDAQKKLDDVKKKINGAFCWFYGATNNPMLTQSIFGVEPEKVQPLSDAVCR